jgi:protein TonB
MHLAIIFIFHAMRPAGEDMGTPAAMMIELTPLPAAAVTDSQTAMSDNVTPEQAQPVEKVEEKVEAEPETVAEPVEKIQREEVAKAEPEEEKKPEEVLPKTVEVKTPEVAIPIPQPRPIFKEKSRPEKKQVKEVQLLPEPRKAKTNPEPTPIEIARLPVQQMPAAPAARSQPARMGAGGVTAASWQRQLQKWVEQYKDYPLAAKRKRQQGTVEVKFTIDANGHITSSRVGRSSGNPLLDQAALNTLQRASPVPAPPMGFNTASLVVMELEFELR